MNNVALRALAPRIGRLLYQCYIAPATASLLPARLQVFCGASGCAHQPRITAPSFASVCLSSSLREKPGERAAAARGDESIVRSGERLLRLRKLLPPRALAACALFACACVRRERWWMERKSISSQRKQQM